MPDELLVVLIVIEQAKGVVAERTGLDMGDAFLWLCDHARSQNLLLAEAAQLIVDGTGTPHRASP